MIIEINTVTLLNHFYKYLTVVYLYW